MEELRWLDPAMTRVLPIIRQVFAQYAPQGFALEFTGGKEWFGHGKVSLHHSGCALDIRTPHAARWWCGCRFLSHCYGPTMEAGQQVGA